MTGEGDDPETVALDLADAVENLTHLWWLAAQDAVPRLSAHQLRALHILHTVPGLNLTALAEQMDIGLPTASRLCDRLEAAGLLERSAHPHRRREVRLGLTTQGRQALADVAQRRARLLGSVLAAMRPAERAELRRGMAAMLRAYGAGAAGHARRRAHRSGELPGPGGEWRAE